MKGAQSESNMAWDCEDRYQKSKILEEAKAEGKHQ